MPLYLKNEIILKFNYIYAINNPLELLFNIILIFYGLDFGIKLSSGGLRFCYINAI